MSKEKTFEELVSERVVISENFAGKLCEYDENDNMIHYKDSNRLEYWREYDKNGNIIHYKNSTGYEEWKEYNSKDIVIHYKNSNGDEKWYNNNGNKITKEEFNKLYNKERLI